MAAQGRKVEGLGEIAKEIRDAVYANLIPDGQIFMLKENRAHLYKQDQISGKYVHVSDDDFDLDIFGTSQDLRDYLVRHFYQKKTLLFTKSGQLAKLVATASPWITQSLVQLNLQFTMPKNRVQEIVLQYLIRGTGDLTPCRNLQTINISIILARCDQQTIIGDVLLSWVRGSLGTSFDVCVTATECRHCVETLDSNLATKADNTQLLSVKGCSQLWEWTCARDTNQWQVARYLVDRASRVRLVSFSDMVSKYQNDVLDLVKAHKDTNAAYESMRASVMNFRHQACGNDQCQDTCVGMPADLHEGRYRWCRRCELIAGCDSCSFRMALHGLDRGDGSKCIAKPWPLNDARAQKIQFWKEMHRSLLRIYKNEYGFNLDRFMSGQDACPLHNHTVTVMISPTGLEFLVRYNTLVMDPHQTFIWPNSVPGLP